MGLDMYVFAIRDAELLEGRQVFPFFEFGGCLLVRPFFQWRKHPDLHGWMENLYRRKGGNAEDFNWEAVVVTKDDIAELEQDVRARRLPKTTGFFFGESCPEDQEDDLSFIEKARAELQKGRTVFYVGDW